MQENCLKKFRTIVSEVSSFVGNPVPKESEFRQSFGMNFVSPFQPERD